ncbi:serine hydroxymethyltransferase [Nitratireductor indicus C115]|uniref:Serine hydroxymethyltransferase n=1 Tax=Nitratireductor indicus C115 TaxID=1231190 RepID=K2P906_9HYPH|nr:serine hydroxymethyltransferase [Nitratireductor indicus]EKF43681.1 serine hydroxymethyltransferase [Nitratireductor indicus C115]SFQ79133.1 glycine hydroxymethyltransferase [Nitratireductor indicus]
MNIENHSRTITAMSALPDALIASAIAAEEERQQNGLELIASENIASRAVRLAQASVFTDKYAEGYPGRRYYGGCGPSDIIERAAVERLCRLFDAGWANVQPHSGVNANLAVFFALLQPGDTILGLDLACGGHLTHGAPVTVSGRWFNAVTYKVRREDELIDYDELERVARKERPKLIVVGGSAYARRIDFARARAIADETGAYLMADIAHYAGLVAAGVYPNPVPHAHIVTSTTHKTLRGPRGGVIMGMDPEIGRRIDKAVFPGVQGGPLMHVIAAKAVAFEEALQPEFRHYAAAVRDNAQALAQTLSDGGLRLVTGGTDCHLLLVDLSPFDIDGRAAADILEQVGLTINKNTIPFDARPPMAPSGIRLGTPSATSRGLDQRDFREVGGTILSVLSALRAADGRVDDVAPAVLDAARDVVSRLTIAHPILR